MPSKHRVVEVKIPESEILADLYGIAYDLDEAIQLCGKALDLCQVTLVDYTLVDAVVVAALIRYFRCMGTGVRLGVHVNDLASLSEEEVRSHRFLKDLRDKHVVHAVNPFEESYVTTTATNRDGELLPITSINSGSYRTILGGETAEMLRMVVMTVQDIVDAKIAAEKEKVLKVLQALPLKEVHAFDLYTPKSNLASQVGKSRK